MGAPVVRVSNLHTLAVTSHGLVNDRTNLFAPAIATVAVAVPPVQATSGVVAPKKPDGKLTVIALGVEAPVKAVARVKLTVTAGTPAPYTVLGVVAVITQDVKVTVPPRAPADAPGLTASIVDRTVTAPEAGHVPTSARAVGPVAMLLKVQTLAVVSHGLVKLIIKVVAASATVAVAVPPVHETVGVVPVAKKPEG